MERLFDRSRTGAQIVYRTADRNYELVCSVVEQQPDNSLYNNTHQQAGNGFYNNAKQPSENSYYNSLQQAPDKNYYNNTREQAADGYYSNTKRQQSRNNIYPRQQSYTDNFL
jgi:hypothetical protein